jgi:hypothetical protein
MGIRDSINALFRNKPVLQTTANARENVAAQSTMEVLNRFKAESERAQIIKTCRQMYKSDPRVKKMMRLFARDLVRSGFLIISKHAQAVDEAKRLQKRLDLNQCVEDWVRLTARDGDSFLEVVVNEALDIQTVSRKPTLKMRRNCNALDGFDNAERAFWMADEIAGMVPPADAIWFAEWQMIHARWEHDPENRYGTPMMESAIMAYKRTTEGETDVAVRRKTRSGVRYNHVLEGASEGDLKAYKEQNHAALENPFAAVSDFFSNRKGTIEVIEGDGKLGEIQDILHHIATMFTAGDVPMELIAYGGELNRDILGEKKAEYAETLEQGREWVTSQILRPLLERQWLLKGILPESVDYNIEWRRASNMSAADIRDIADGISRLRLLGVREDVLRTLLARYLPGVDAEVMTDDTAIDTERFADMLKGISI